MNWLATAVQTTMAYWVLAATATGCVRGKYCQPETPQVWSDALVVSGLVSSSAQGRLGLPAVVAQMLM